MIVHMKYLYCLCILFIAGCGEQEEAAVPEERLEAEWLGFPEKYIFDVGVTHFFEETQKWKENRS